MVDLGSFVSTCWNAALKEARNSVVFIDKPCCESLRWAGGLERLENAGATSVKEFSAFVSGKPTDTKALFLIAEDLQSFSIQTMLKSILHSSSFDNCTIISGLPIRPTPGRTAQQEIQWLQREMREWMGSVDETFSKVVYLPLVISCVLPNVALLHSFENLFPPLMEEDSPGQLPPEERKLLDQLVTTLSSLLEQFAMRDTLYSVGKFSYTVADEVEQLQATSKRRGTLSPEAKQASVILMDRTLDLVFPLSFQKESFLDVIRAVLPAFDSTDVAIDMSPVCTASCKKIDVGYTIARGTLSCIPIAKREKLHNLKWKLVPLHLRDEFTYLTDCCSVGDRLEQRNDPLLFVKDNLKVFRKNASAYKEHADSLVELVGITQLLTSKKLQQRNEKLAVEKIFMQNATGNVLSGAIDSGDALVELMQSKEKMNLSFEDLVCFYFYIHSLCGEELYIDQRTTETLRHELLNALTEESLRNQSLWSNLTRNILTSSNPTESQLQGAIAKIQKVASRISKQRKTLKHYKQILRKGDLTSPATYKPIVREIFEDMKTGIDSSDLEKHDLQLDGLGILKGGFGLLYNFNKTSSSPLTGTDLIIFVALGGITFAEIKMIEETFEETGKQVIFLTTAMLTPSETVLKTVNAIVN